MQKAGCVADLCYVDRQFWFLDCSSRRGLDEEFLLVVDRIEVVLLYVINSLVLGCKQVDRVQVSM